MQHEKNYNLHRITYLIVLLVAFKMDKNLSDKINKK